MSSDAIRPRMRSTEGGDNLTGIDDRLASSDTGSAAAVRSMVTIDVLCHVHKAAGQVARVGCLERGVGQPLARAVGRVEVLEQPTGLP